ncbi:MAG: hypothetical protein F4Z32_13050 [Gemmatimonadetes bacterium]|nr:hypothetical protein [Gemmatimonadota bacterium]
MMNRTQLPFALAAALALFPHAGFAAERVLVPSAAPEPAAPEQLPPDSITVSFHETPIRDVLFAFSEFSGRSIVAGARVEGLLSAEIRGQPWDVALRALMEAYGLVVHEQENGIIRVADARQLFENEAVLPVATRSFRTSYVEAGELEALASALLTERGRTSVGVATNTVVVTDIPRILDAVAQLVDALDVRVMQVDIAAKIIFINRTRLEGFGITYDLKDTGGNQLNFLTPGVADTDGDGVISLPEEQVPRGTDVVALGGNSIAALGNAGDRIVGPTLSVLTSLVVGRSTLIGFIDALDANELTNVEAQPSVRVMDNRTARILVGEETPVRVLDAGAQLQPGTADGSGGVLPVATVDYMETGVILEVSPRITAGGDILLDLSAERSSADLAPSDVGLTFRRQKAESQVLLRDGETVVIGGLTVAEAGEVRAGIPLLMDLPLIGRLFSTERKSSVQRDLLIMVTPTIVPGTSP